MVAPNSPANFARQKAYDFDNDADDPLDKHVNEKPSPTSTPPSWARSRVSKRANISKPVTRIRRELTIPSQGDVDRGRFKTLLVTPRVTKPPGWRLGSGFDGITLEPFGIMRPRISRKQDFGHARSHRFLDRSVSKLDLSTGSPPSRHFVGERSNSKRHESHCNPGQTRNFDSAIRSRKADGTFEGGLARNIGEHATLTQTVNLTAPVHHPSTENHSSEVAFHSHHDVTVKEPTQMHQFQRRNPDASHEMREPSKSERKGWLKRKRVDFVVVDEDERRLSMHAETDYVNASEHGRRSGRDGVDRLLNDVMQAQHAFGDEL